MSLVYKYSEEPFDFLNKKLQQQLLHIQRQQQLQQRLQHQKILDLEAKLLKARQNKKVIFIMSKFNIAYILKHLANFSSTTSFSSLILRKLTIPFHPQLQHHFSLLLLQLQHQFNSLHHQSYQL